MDNLYPSEKNNESKKGNDHKFWRLQEVLLKKEKNISSEQAAYNLKNMNIMKVKQQKQNRKYNCEIKIEEFYNNQRK